MVLYSIVPYVLSTYSVDILLLFIKVFLIKIIVYVLIFNYLFINIIVLIKLCISSSNYSLVLYIIYNLIY